MTHSLRKIVDDGTIHMGRIRPKVAAIATYLFFRWSTRSIIRSRIHTRLLLRLAALSLLSALGALAYLILRVGPSGNRTSLSRQYGWVLPMSVSYASFRTLTTTDLESPGTWSVFLSSAPVSLSIPMFSGFGVDGWASDGVLPALICRSYRLSGVILSRYQPIPIKQFVARWLITIGTARGITERSPAFNDRLYLSRLLYFLRLLVHHRHHHTCDCLIWRTDRQPISQNSRRIHESADMLNPGLDKTFSKLTYTLLETLSKITHHIKCVLWFIWDFFFEKWVGIQPLIFTRATFTVHIFLLLFKMRVIRWTTLD